MRTSPSRRALLLILLALALALAAVACGTEEPAEPTGAEGAGEATEDPDEADADDPGAGVEGDEASEASMEPGDGLTVGAPMYPLAWVAQQVAPGAELVLLTGAGDDPHDIELTPRGRELLETADVVLYMGDIGYQPQVERAMEVAGGEVVSFSETVGPGSLLDWAHDHDDDHSHDADHDDDHSRSETLDPHAWFDAGLMAEMTEAVGEAMASADPDPDRGSDYRDNADALAEDFRELAAEIEQAFAAGCAHDRVIVSHEAYAYLVEPFGFQQEGVSGVGGHGPASPQRIADLVRTVREEGIEHVLAEPVEGREDAAAVANEAGVELLDIYSLEVVDDEGLFAEHGFLELLRQQADTVATALGCGQDS